MRTKKDAMEQEDKQLKKIFQEGHQQDSPSLSFTANVMRKVEAKRAEKLKPIIGKWGWIMIAIFVVLIGVTPFLTNSFDNSGTLMSNLPKFNSLFVIIIMSGLFILFDDLIIRRRRTDTE